VPPRPHPIVLIALAVACFVVAFLVAPRKALPSEGPRAALAGVGEAAPGSAPQATWRWPLRGRVIGAFRLTPHAPFARGQRRGIDVAASAGTQVRAACPGRVTFAGPLPHGGLAVTVRCGALVATYLRLGDLAVRRGSDAAVGERLGTLGPDGRLRLGARRAGDRRGYIDPLTLLREPDPTATPTLGPAPRPRPPRPAPVPPPTRPRPAPSLGRTEPRSLPWPAYPALALIATALPLGGLVHGRRRRRASTATAAVHEGP
jgi:murein DD-endopeptidase MepM/ murein hydrolase activator NlpD